MSRSRTRRAALAVISSIAAIAIIAGLVYFMGKGVGIGTIPGLDTTNSGSHEKTCTLEDTPVCVDDTETYSNECDARKAGFTQWDAGACDATNTGVNGDIEPIDSGTTSTGILEGEACPSEYAPVCGKDGSTYKNTCEALKNNTSVVADQACKEDTTENSGSLSNETCVNEYVPVCAEKGDIQRTYRNVCEAKRNEATVIADGTCKSDAPAKDSEPTDVQTGSTVETPTENVPSADAEKYASGAYHHYSQASLHYAFEIPNYCYYQGYGARDGALHTMAVGLTDSDIASFEDAPVRIYLYKKDATPTDTSSAKSHTLEDGRTVYVFLNKTYYEANPKYQKKLDTIVTTVTESAR